MNIFISYAREDSESANRLYHELLAIHGVTPWLDSKKLLPGVRWKLEIMEALKTCDLFVILLSSNSVSKNGFVQRELAEALDKLKSYPPDRIFLIPARLEDCHPKHPELNELQWVDLFPDWDSGCALILKAIQKMMPEYPIVTQSVPDDVVMETFTSADAFLRRLRTRSDMRGCDAMGLEFEGQNFQNLDFAGSNFVRCSFVNCDFQHCNLKGVNFEGASLKNCNFAKANLWGVNFWGAIAIGINDLDQATLKYTNFFGTRLSRKQDEFLDSRVVATG